MRGDGVWASPPGGTTPRQVTSKPSSLSEGEVVFVTTGSDKGWWTAGSDGVPYAATIKRKPRMLLPWNYNRNVASHTFPTDYAKWSNFRFIVRTTSNDELNSGFLPISMLTSADITFTVSQNTTAGFVWDLSERSLTLHGSNRKIIFLCLE